MSTPTDKRYVRLADDLLELRHDLQSLRRALGNLAAYHTERRKGDMPTPTEGRLDICCKALDLIEQDALDLTCIAEQLHKEQRDAAGD